MLILRRQLTILFFVFLACTQLWAGPTLLLTGGTGYIGSHTAVLLLQDGYDIVIVDNLSNSEPSVVQRIEEITQKKVKAFYAYDLTDADSIRKIFKTHPDIKLVIHFAGLKSVDESVLLPLAYYKNNVVASLNLIEVMTEHKCRNLVFSSSAAVYGNAHYVPIDEKHPTNPTNTYGQTKLDIEHIMSNVALANKDNRFIALRYFNPVGAHSSGLLGERPREAPKNLVPFMVQVSQGKQPKLMIYGSDYDTEDGTAVRDYFHIMDLAQGHLDAVKYALEKSGPGFQVFNLGSGSGHTVKQMLDAFTKALGREIPWEYAPRRQGDVGNVYASTTRARDVLGFKPTRGLDEMMRDALGGAKE